MVETNKHEFKRKYPNLAEELELQKGTFEIMNVDGAHVIEGKNKDPFAGYVPTAIDYLRRCDNEIQVEETINYLEKKGEITGEYANRLRKILQEKGLRSFGPKKEDDYYFKRAGYG